MHFKTVVRSPMLADKHCHSCRRVMVALSRCVVCKNIMKAMCYFCNKTHEDFSHVYCMKLLRLNMLEKSELDTEHVITSKVVTFGTLSFIK